MPRPEDPSETFLWGTCSVACQSRRKNFGEEVRSPFPPPLFLSGPSPLSESQPAPEVTLATIAPEPSQFFFSNLFFFFVFFKRDTPAVSTALLTNRSFTSRNIVSLATCPPHQNTALESVPVSSCCSQPPSHNSFFSANTMNRLWTVEAILVPVDNFSKALRTENMSLPLLFSLWLVPSIEHAPAQRKKLRWNLASCWFKEQRGNFPTGCGEPPPRFRNLREDTL